MPGVSELLLPGIVISDSDAVLVVSLMQSPPSPRSSSFISVFLEETKKKKNTCKKEEHESVKHMPDDPGSKEAAAACNEGISQ
jgi:hypothetical protein